MYELIMNIKEVYSLPCLKKKKKKKKKKKEEENNK